MEATGLVRRIFVDSSPKGEIRWFDKTTGRFGKRRISTKRALHESELLAVLRTLEDNSTKFAKGDTVEICCDRQTAVQQLNREAGISERPTLQLADKIWTMAVKLKEDQNVKVKFVWVSRKENLAGKMLGT